MGGDVPQNFTIPSPAPEMMSYWRSSHEQLPSASPVLQILGTQTELRSPGLMAERMWIRMKK